MEGGTRALRLGIALVLGALCAAAPAAARPTGAPGIVGGQPAVKAYPYAAFVKLAYADGSVGFCGGSLVAARYVVTAGHCLDDSPTRIDVTVGSPHVSHDAATPGEYPNVAAVRDPQFGTLSGEPVNDAAVLTLPAAAPEAQVRLPRPADAGLWGAGATATALGWGRCGVLELSCGTLPDDLREVALALQPDSACSTRYAYAAGSMLCAGGDPGRDTCNGDSGGPLVVDDGAGSPVLAGATSFGSAGCDGSAAVYTRLGGTALNAWLRSVVPQVEIDPSTTQPVPGQAVTFTAVPHRPGGGGPFGGYDELSWDLDGDGAFGEAPGALTVGRPMARGVNAIAVRAADGAGDAEVRTIHVQTVDRAAIAFATPAVTVTEGHAATLTLGRVGTGGGSVTVTPVSGTARVGRDVRSGQAPAVAFAATDASHTVSIATRDDRRPERTERFTVVLGGFSGALQAGDPATAVVTVRDDDPAVSVKPSRRVRAGRFALRLKADRAGRFTTTVRARAGRARAVKLRGAARRTVAVRLSARTRRALVAHGRLRLHVRVVFRPADRAYRTVAVRHTVRLRPAT
jgi:Trypsin